MTTELNWYPEMRESGVEWLGQVPSHWNVQRIKTILQEVDNRTDSGIEQLLSLRMHQGLIPHNEVSEKRISPSDLVGYKVVNPGSMVMNRMRAAIGIFGIADTTGLVSPDYAIFEVAPDVDAEYLLRLFKAPGMCHEFLINSKGLGTGSSGFMRLYTDQFGIICVPVPPPHEQLLITRYLTHINNRINRFIRAKRRLIELLEEEKRVVVHQAVTRGLDPDATMKDSGVEWLGEVPEGWEVRRLKTLCTMQSGDSITSESIEESGSYPVYGGNGVRGFSEEFTHSGEFALIGRQGALCGNVHLARGEFWASEHAVVATLGREHDIRWFALLLEAMNLNQYSIAAAQPGLSVERLINLWAPVPPVTEQARLAENVEQALAACATAQERTTHQITLLQEYRTRLISDVVTGKLDVREVAAGLPEVEDEVDAGEGEGVEEVDEVLEEEVG